MRGAVCLHNVDFSYPTRPDNPVLSQCQLEIRLGEVLALVGPSGSGKSTIIAALLSRMYDPIWVKSRLMEHPLRDLKLDWLRAQVGVVSQEPILFASSVADNIRYARLEQAWKR